VNFDLVIVLPLLKRSDIEYLEDHGVVVLGYLSITTIGGWEPWSSNVTSDMIIEYWSTWNEAIVNVSHTKWRDIVREAVTATSYISLHPYLKLYIRNIGTSKATITSVYVKKTNGNLAATGAIVTASREVELEAGEVASFNAILKESLPPDVYIVKVVATRGSIATQGFKLEHNLFKGIVMNVTESNNENNKVTAEDEYAEYEV